MILTADHIEDDPTDPAMCIVYVGWGGPNQLAARVERASILVLSERPSSAFVEYQEDGGATACGCPPCPGRGNDGHGMTHCAECCFGTGVEGDPDCPMHGAAAIAADHTP